MKLEPISNNDSFNVSPEVLLSFASPPFAYRVSGPGRLVRLVQHQKVTREQTYLKATREDGLFWFEENLLIKISNLARADLHLQQRGGLELSNSMSSLIGLYAKFCLRDHLAICKDWTQDFDAYVTLDLAKDDSVIAYVGATAGQPYYSPKDARHTAADAQKVILPGGHLQFVIDFRFPANKPLASAISSPPILL